MYNIRSKTHLLRRCETRDYVGVEFCCTWIGTVPGHIEAAKSLLIQGLLDGIDDQAPRAHLVGLAQLRQVHACHEMHPWFASQNKVEFMSNTT